MNLSDKALNDYRRKMIAFEDEVKKAIVGIDDIIELVALAVFSRGHVLLDGLPGVAKTTLCLAVARALNGEMVKFEGRPDFTPSQFLYVTEPDREGNPKFYKGPLITKAPRLVLSLLDEVTRFISQAQAFWFEIMNEFRMTLPTEEINLSHNRVFATKNKVTRGETFEIPQPQLDRFLLNLELRYPDPSAEMEIMTDEKYDDPGKLVLAVSPVVDLDELEEVVEAIQPGIRLSRSISKYMFEVVEATRYPSRYGIVLEGIDKIDDLIDNRQNASGISPRGAARWRRAAKVAAFRRGSDFLAPEDLLRVAEPALVHRIFINLRAAGARNRALLARDFLGAILKKVEAP